MSRDDDTREQREQRNVRLAEQRTLLEHERTLAAWIRTALATIVLGFAAAELLGTVSPRWLAQALGAVLILAGGAMLGISYRSYRGAIHELARRKIPGIPPWVLAVFVLVLVLSATVGLALVLVSGPLL